MATTGVRLSDYAGLLRGNRNFRLLWGAQVVSEFGDWFYSVAIFSFLLEVAGTAQSVAIAFMLQVLPQCLAAPAAGVINDRMSRRKIMLFADWTRAAIVLLMLFVRTREAVPLLYVLLFSETLMWALFEPARSAVLPNVVREDQLPAANALQATTWSFNFAAGSALGGLTAVLFGNQAVFIFNSLTFALSAPLIRRMKFDEPHVADAPPFHARELADFTPVAEGIEYVRRDPRLSATLFVKAGLSLMGTNWVLIPVMGERLFPVHLSGFDSRQAATLGMSLLMGSRGVGAIIGAFAGARFTGTDSWRLRISIAIGFLIGALGYLILAGAPAIWIACAGLVIAHAGASMIWTSSSVLMQSLTGDRFRGRVFSAEFALSMFTLAAVSSTGGVLLDHNMSLRALALATALVFLMPAGFWILAQRRWKV